MAKFSMQAFKMAAANILKGLLLLISLCVVAKPSDAFDYGLFEETCQEVNLSNWSVIRSLFLKDEALLEFMKINNESLFQFVEALQVDNPFTAHIAGEPIFSSPEIKTFELSSSLAVAVEVKRNENRRLTQTSTNGLPLSNQCRIYLQKMTSLKIIKIISSANKLRPSWKEC